MASMKKESKYSLVGAEEVDIGNESDTTACSTGSMRRRNSRRETRSQSKSSSRVEAYLTWLRWGIVIVLQMAMLTVLLLRTSTGDCPLEVETGGDINGLYRTCKFGHVSEIHIRLLLQDLELISRFTVSHKVVHLAPQVDLYMPNMTSDDNRMEIRRNWDALMPRMLITRIPLPFKNICTIK